MNFVDLGRQYEVIGDKIEAGVLRVLRSGHYIMGEEIKELEKKLAEFAGRKYCLTCGSGTEALQIPLMAYELKKKGLDLPDGILTIPELVDAICQ